MKQFEETIREAAARSAPLQLRGGGTKDFYGNTPRGEVIDTRGYAGIVDYEPTELVVTVRCGTALSELERTLAENNQFLPFEPPYFGAGATVGGCVATGLSGPRRASAGALRDFVLGARVVDGRGRSLSFGGQVMKNVAGYDVARLMAGSLGTLALLTEVSLKVLPRPAVEKSLRQELTQAQALERLSAWAAQPLPISATAWTDGALTLRLSGAEPAVRAAAARLGGDEVADADRFWSDVREQTGSFFSGPQPLWRIAVSPVAPPLELPGRQLLEWRGGLRWLKSDAEAGAIRAAAAACGGHATFFRGTRGVNAFDALDAVKLRLHRALKKTFDPAGIFNPGRMYAEL